MSNGLTDKGLTTATSEIGVGLIVLSLGIALSGLFIGCGLSKNEGRYIRDGLQAIAENCQVSETTKGERDE